MNITREKKKQEAIKRMKALGLISPCIEEFDRHDTVWLSEPNGGLYEFSSNDKLIETIERVEREFNSLVYHVIHSRLEFGDMYSLLLVSDYEQEWEMDNADIEDGIVMTYTWNKTFEHFSEFGSIGVLNMFGGLVRTC